MGLGEDALKELGRNVRRENRKNAIKKFALAIGILLACILVFKWIRGDYKFAFHDVEFTQGVVIDTRIENQGRFKDQDVLYEYYVDDIRYTGTSYELMKQRRNGDEVKIKYAVDKPEIHEAIWQY